MNHWRRPQRESTFTVLGCIIHQRIIFIHRLQPKKRLYQGFITYMSCTFQACIGWDRGNGQAGSDE